MEQEFKVSIGFRFFYGIVLSGLIFLVVFAFYRFGIANKNGVDAMLLAIAVPCCMMLINVFRSKVTITDLSITRTTAFGTKELLFADVKGCRIGDKTIRIDPVDVKTSPRITINNYIDFDNSDELKKLIAAKFTDLNEAGLKFEQEKFFENERYGLTVPERKSTLKKVKIIAVIYSVIGVLLTFAMIPVDEGYFPSLLMMGYPLLGIIIIVTSGGLTKFVSSSKVSINPFVGLGMVMSMVIMLFKSLNDFEIYSYANVWIPWLIIGAVLFAMLYLWGLNWSLPSIKAQVIFMMLVCCLYGYGSLIQLNCVFDHSAAQVYKTSVYNKWVSHGKSTNYYLTLNPWEAGKKTKDVAVYRSRYNAANIGDTISVSTKKGLLRIPWFYVAQ
jgi:hypothetical protein